MEFGLSTSASLSGAQTQPIHKRLNASFTKLTATTPTATSLSDGTQQTASLARSQARPLVLAERNVFNAISMVSIADESYGNIENVLGQMRDLVSQATPELSDADRSHLTVQYAELSSSLNQIRAESSYNGVDLLGQEAQAMSLQAPTSPESNAGLKLPAFDWSAPPDTALSGDPAARDSALLSISIALHRVSSNRTTLSESFGQLQQAAQFVQTQRLNLAASHSRIRDVSSAEELAKLTGSQVQQQPEVSVSGQTNQLPQVSADLLK